MEQDELMSDLGVVFRPESLAKDAQEVRERHEANRLAWNEGAAYYTAGLEDTLAFLRNGGSNLHPIERTSLGDLRAWCTTAIHLQCASGRDTLSLWNEGVERVIGIDISDVHIANARRLSQALRAPATWYRCDLLETPHALDGCADLVYTGRGALCWLHDLDRWAAVIFRLLKAGGILHLFEAGIGRIPGTPTGGLANRALRGASPTSIGRAFPISVQS
jgi:SAM-dependent methyltransferase